MHIDAEGTAGVPPAGPPPSRRRELDTHVDEATIGTRTYTLTGEALEAREGGRVVWTKRWDASSPGPPTARP